MSLHAHIHHLVRCVLRMLVLVLVAALPLRAATARGQPPPLRFSPEFSVSPAMEERIRFWVRVFTEVSHRDVLLHDRDDVRLVYGIVPYGRGEAVEPARASYA